MENISVVSVFGINPYQGLKTQQVGHPDNFIGRIMDKACACLQAGRLKVFDAAAGINQCHVIALLVAKIYEAKKLDFEKTRFLTLCLFVSQTFQRGKTYIEDFFSLKKKEGNRFLQFLIKSKKHAQLALSHIIKEHFGQGTGGDLYRPSKLLGVDYFLKHLDVAVVYKIKVVRGEAHTVKIFEMGPRTEGCVVFEGVSLDMTFLNYLEMKKKCQQFFLQQARHSCSLCVKKTLIFEPIVDPIEEVLFANGADFMRSTRQLTDDLDERLKGIYEHSLRIADLKGYAQNRPFRFVIEHAYPARLSEVIEERRASYGQLEEVLL